MANPHCPNCGNLLVTKTMDTRVRLTQLGFRKLIEGLKITMGDYVKGRSKYWFCRKCKKRWKKGGEVIRGK